MFGLNEIALKEKIESLKKALETSDRDALRFKEAFEEEKKNGAEKVERLEKDIKNIKEDFASQKRISDNELSVKIQEAIKKEVDKNAVLKNENDVLKKEVEILNKAFENMGFDVKDMKSILDKLVDGIVSKGIVNIVK